MVIIFKNDTAGYMLCGRFEYFGSYFGNPGVIRGRMDVTERLAESGSAEGWEVSAIGFLINIALFVNRMIFVGNIGLKIIIRIIH
jgi:hypothetical protein